MNSSTVWYATLSIIADFSPVAYWHMSNGAWFWWRLTSRAQLSEDRFAEQPFAYDEIVSVLVFSEIRFRREVLSCDWPSLRRALLNIPGLHAEERIDVVMPGASPPNHALYLTVPPAANATETT